MKHVKTHDATGRTMTDHRSRRPPAARSWLVDPGASPLPGAIQPATLGQALDAFGVFDPTAPWPEIAPFVLPLLKRVRHPFPAEYAPIHLRVPPGVWAGFGIDVGPAWAYVSRDLVARWRIDEATLLGTALDNLRERAVSDPPRVERVTFADVEATVIQAQGWGSALILAPDRLTSILGDAAQTILVPVRDALIALPEDVDLDLAVAIWEAFAERRVDELDVDPLRWTGSSVVTFEEEPTVRLN